MTTVTLQIVEGVDKGRIFRDLPTPMTIGREEGNVLRLNDERVSRFHAKVQQDNGDIILTDLESTNGTRVNGSVIQIRRLRLGDLICVGRSLLLYGSNEEIAARLALFGGLGQPPLENLSGEEVGTEGPGTIRASHLAKQLDPNLDFDLNPRDEVTIAEGNLFIGNRPLPPLPQKLSPSQAARLAEILEFLHRGLVSATGTIQANDDGTEIRLTFPDWQKLLAVQMLLARYLRAISEPEALAE